MIRIDRRHAFRLQSHRAKTALVVCALLAATTECGSDERRPSLVQVGGSSASGGSAGSIAKAGSDAAGSLGLAGDSASDAGDGNTDAGGNAGEQAAGGRPTVEPAACAQNPNWSAAASIAGVSSAETEIFLSVTPDELDLAFLRAGALYVAHRAQVSAAFTLGSAVVVPQGWSAAQGAALSADGKRLILVSTPDQKKLGELTRPSRSAVFTGPIDETAFAAVNQDSVFTGTLYASPTVSAGDDRLFFNAALLESSTVVVSTRTGNGNGTDTDAWSPPKQLVTSLLDGAAGKRRLPTGVSTDTRTLFYFNEESAKEEARWRTSTAANSPLYDMLSLGARRGAAPNSACNRLYFATDGDVVAEKD